MTDDELSKLVRVTRRRARRWAMARPGIDKDEAEGEALALLAEVINDTPPGFTVRTAMQKQLGWRLADWCRESPHWRRAYGSGGERVGYTVPIVNGETGAPIDLPVHDTEFDRVEAEATLDAACKHLDPKEELAVRARYAGTPYSEAMHGSTDASRSSQGTTYRACAEAKLRLIGFRA